MLPPGAGGEDVCLRASDDSRLLRRSSFHEEFDHMKKTIIVSLAILGLSASAALAAKPHHAKKPEAAPAPTYAAETHIFHVSDADKALWAKNKRESGVK
jgi:hypothetical protein